MKKIAFYITNQKGFYVLDNFIQKFSSDPIAYVVSAQDKSIQKDFYSEIKNTAKYYGISFFQKGASLKKIESVFEGYKFAIGWRWIIENRKNLIIFHDSLLPKNRGFAPLVNSMINGDKELGITALFASENYDEGPIISQESFTITYPIKILDVIEKSTKKYFQLVERIFSQIRKNEDLVSIEQDSNEASYSPWLNQDDYFIEWKSWSSSKIKRFIDAVGYPYNGARSILNKQEIIIWEAEEEDDVVITDRERHLGKVLFIKNKVPVVICKKGLLSLKKVTSHSGEFLLLEFRSRFY